MQDIFFSTKQEYTTALNPVGQYIKQLTHYIEKKKNWSPERAKKKATEIFRSHFQDKAVKCFERGDNGDRSVRDTTLLTYIKENLTEGNIFTPTFTSYMSTSKKKSILSEFIFVSVERRAKAKREEHAAKSRGDMVLAAHKNNEQNNLKIYNNSMSGAFAMIACILYNPSNHSTLTSITRTITSLSNANNERIISGNRYYPRAIDVMNDIVYISSETNEQKVREAMACFGLHYPSVEDVVSVLKRSSDLYFFDRAYYTEHIVPFLQTLSPESLASICYSGDLYHLRVFNPEFIRRILVEVVKKVEVQERQEGVAEKIWKLDENLVNFVHHIFFKELKGKGKDYSKMPDTGIPESIYATCQNATSVLFEYQLFFNTFFMNTIMPVNSFRLRGMVRRTVVLSDTDSTCFTLDEWVRWFRGGEFHIDEETLSITGALSYMVTQSIVNFLRILSRNLNIDESLIDKMGMKNEFLWLAHSPVEASKHYYAYTVLQEGTVLTVPEIEIKGVHLKNSAVPKFVIDDSKALMRFILEKVSVNEKFKLQDVIDRIISLERSIKASVYKGESVFLKKSKINTAESYALEANKSPYARHTFWVEVFAEKYGEVPEPPYGVVKLPTTVQSKTKLNAWIESIEDLELRGRLASWLVKNEKSKLPTIYLQDTYVKDRGIPKEVISVVDINRVVLDVTIQHRLILETLGVVLYKDRLVEEQFNTQLAIA